MITSEIGAGVIDLQAGQLPEKEALVAPRLDAVVLYIIVPDIWKGSEGLVCAKARLSPAFAGVAQSVEHLICNQRVGGSNPFASSRERSSTASIAGRKKMCPAGGGLRS